jgi:uncharacterized protein YkwD
MKTSPLSLNVIAIAALASCANQPALTRTPVPLRTDSSLAGQVLDDVNAYRNSIGVSDLQRDAGLDRLAKSHCDYLLENSGTFTVYGKYVSHMGAEGRSLIAMKRLDMMSTSENIASTMSVGSNARTARNLVILWQNSHDHDFAMRTPSWTHTGIATTVGPDGRVYAAQIFSTKKYSKLAANTNFNQF